MGSARTCTVEGAAASKTHGCSDEEGGIELSTSNKQNCSAW